MSTIQFISLYLALGFVWLGIIEYITTSWKVGGEWENGERIIQMLLWPVFFFNFVIAFWIEFFKQNNDTYND